MFRLAAEAGFRGLELMVTKNEETQSIPLILDLVDEFGLDIRTIHAPFLLAARKVWGEPLEKIERSVAMAQQLGSKVVVAHLPYFWQWSYARWAHRSLDDTYGDSNVMVAMENAMFVNLYRPLNLSLFNNLRDMGHFENLVFDTSHYAIAKIDIFEAWRELREHVRHIHLSNNYMKGFDDHALPFEGRLPLDRFLKLLRRDGYEGTIALELGPGPLEARLGETRIVYNLRRSLEFCTAHYGKDAV